MTRFGAVAALLVLPAFAIGGLAVALRLWPADEPAEIAHRHDDLSADHPHLQGHRTHHHAYIIDMACTGC